MIKKKIKVVEITAKVYVKKTGKLEEMVITVRPVRGKVDKEVLAYEERHAVKIVEIIDTKEVDHIYTMTMDDFIKQATLVEDKKGGVANA